MPATLQYTSLSEALAGCDTLLFVGTKARLTEADVLERVPAAAHGAWGRLVGASKPGRAGTTAETWLDGDAPARLVACVLPEAVSRHNCPARPHALHRLVKRALKPRGVSGVVLALEDAQHAFAAGCAVARALPLFSAKSRRPSEDDPSSTPFVRVATLGPDGAEVDARERLRHAAEGIRLAARLVDMPTAELHTDAFVDELRTIASETGAALELLRGEELDARGYGGLWNVGRTAVHPPALVVLSHEPAGARETVALVGKGIVYDTGGLSLKTKNGMPGMKADMGGAAAVAGAFRAAAASGLEKRLHAVFCLAENAIGPEALRPDDVIQMASGRTVEVNNTDAEGRLVLGDGVAHAVRHLAPDVIVDLATLTGAQLVATGRRHAAAVCSDEGLEQALVAAGRRSGDLVHPLPYCPEFFFGEFKSKVADMKNSVKDRANAQSSCAAQFIAEHLGDYEGAWGHVDMAGPATSEERGTGYGVALLLELLEA